MSEFFERVRALVRTGDVLISEHGYDELADDGLTAREVLGGVQNAVIVDEYPEYPKGPCVLLLQQEPTGSPIHVYGASQKVMIDLWLWLPPIVQIRGGGMKHSRGGCNDGTEKKGKMCSRRPICGRGRS